MANVTIPVVAGDLASRTYGARVRRQIEQTLSEGASQVTVDLSAAASISPSFADEVFGVLFQLHGIEWFIEHLHVTVSDESALFSVAQAIRYRVRQSETGATLDLLKQLDCSARQEKHSHVDVNE